MSFENSLFPHLGWVVEHQGPVAWIYLVLLLCLSVRLWLSLRSLTMPREQRTAFQEQTYTLSEATGNIALLFGVLGTLIGVAIAATGKSGTSSMTEFMTTFSSAFGIAVMTTIAGGLSYALCYLLSSLDEYLAGGNQ